MAKHAIPGASIAVIEDFEVAWARDWPRRRGGQAGDAATRFQAASISKPVTAVAAMIAPEPPASGSTRTSTPSSAETRRWQPAAGWRLFTA